MPTARIDKFQGVSYGKLGDRRVVDAAIAQNNEHFEPMQTSLLVEKQGYKRLIATDCAHYGSNHDCVSMVRNVPGCDDIVIVAGYGNAKAVKLACDGNHIEASIQFPCGAAPSLQNLGSPSSAELAEEETSAVYTYVNDFGWESGPSAPSNAVRVSHGNKLSITGIDWTDVPAGINVVRVYLYAAGPKQQAPNKTAILGGYFLAGVLKRGQTTLTRLFGQLGEGLMTIGDEPIPRGIRRMAANRTGIFAGLVGKNVLAMSVPNMPWSWPSGRRMIFDGVGKAVAVGDSILYVLTDGRPFIVDISKRDCDGVGCFNAKQLPGQYPVIGPDSVAIAGDTVYYATLNGIVALSGDRAQMLVADEQSHWMALDPHTFKATVANGYYYAFGDQVSFAVRLDGSGLTELSERGVTAVASSDNGRVLVSANKRTYDAFAGDEFRTARYVVKILENGKPIAFSAWKIDASIAPARVRHILDDNVIDEEEVIDDEPRRIPRIRTRNLFVEIETTGRVAGYAIATGIAEL